MNDHGPRFYFSLLRLMAMLRGGDATRSENNGAEAWVAGIATYLVSYLFFAQFVPADLRFWQTSLLLAGLAFLVWLFWLLALYLNSLIIGFLRLGGFFRGIPVRRAQSVLLATTATAMSVQLLQRGGWPTEIAAIWLIAVAMNLAAAAVLAFRNGTRGHD
jgi:hypothetical protein